MSTTSHRPRRPDGSCRPCFVVHWHDDPGDLGALVVDGPNRGHVRWATGDVDDVRRATADAPWIVDVHRYTVHLIDGDVDAILAAHHAALAALEASDADHTA